MFKKLTEDEDISFSIPGLFARTCPEELSTGTQL